MIFSTKKKNSSFGHFSNKHIRTKCESHVRIVFFQTKIHHFTISLIIHNSQWPLKKLFPLEWLSCNKKKKHLQSWKHWSKTKTTNAIFLSVIPINIDHRNVHVKKHLKEDQQKKNTVLRLKIIPNMRLTYLDLPSNIILKLRYNTKLISKANSITQSR